MIHESATIDPGAVIDETAYVWHRAHVRSGAIVGAGSVIGGGAYIGPGIKIGKYAKIQNGAQVYEPCEIEDGVFIGPGVIFTNDRNPRAVSPTGRQLLAGEWEAVGVHVGEGASIGAGSICVAPLRIGKWALVAAGSVVTKDVPDFALMKGTPARRVGWVGKHGTRLTQVGESPEVFRCNCGAVYRQTALDTLEET